MEKRRIIQLVAILAVQTFFLPPIHAAGQGQDGVPMLSLLLFAGKDCNNAKDGTAYIDRCNACVEGDTGNLPCGDVTSLTGRIWLDRNLGATRVATSSSDSAAWGGLYQWGRASDGHQSRTSAITSANSGSNTPGHKKYIIEPVAPKDWRDPQENNLWQTTQGGNNPCSQGFRLPTQEEWDAEWRSWGPGTKDQAAFNSPLKLVTAGSRSSKDGTIDHYETGFYWSSTVDGSDAKYLLYADDFVFIPEFPRASGFSVRCIKDTVSVSK